MSECNLTVIEAMGMTPEKFAELYKQNNGFNNQFHQNHPSYTPDEDFWSFIMNGSKKLAQDEPEFVESITQDEPEFV